MIKRTRPSPPSVFAHCKWMVGRPEVSWQWVKSTKEHGPHIILSWEHSAVVTTQWWQCDQTVVACKTIPVMVDICHLQVTLQPRSQALPSSRQEKERACLEPRLTGLGVTDGWCSTHCLLVLAPWTGSGEKAAPYWPAYDCRLSWTGSDRPGR